MDSLPEGDRPAMLGNLLEPGSPAVGEHEVRFGDPGQKKNEGDR